MQAATPNQRFRLHVSGMTCTSCEHHVEQALHAAGAADATADFRRGEVVFSVDGEPDDALLRTAVAAIGYVPGDIELLPVANQETSELVDYRLPVEGMTCADCERHVVEALQEAGALKADANFRLGEVRFSAPASVDPRHLEQSVVKTGYTPGRVESLAREQAERGSNGRSVADRYDMAIVAPAGARSPRPSPRWSVARRWS